MFGLGLPEMGIIALAAVLIFGPKKIPELGRTLGKTLRGFKDELQSPEAEAEEQEQKRENQLKVYDAGLLPKRMSWVLKCRFIT